MAGWFDKNSAVESQWIQLQSENDWHAARLGSVDKPTLVFKHSTRCGISSMALKQFERDWNLSQDDCHLYYIDILAHRKVSNLIAEELELVHESPQVLLMINKELMHHASHAEIDSATIMQLIQQVK